MRRASRAIALVLLATLVASCAAWSVDTRIKAGQAITILEDRFKATAEVYDMLKRDGTFTEVEYAPWREFVPRFKAIHKRAVAVWRASGDDQALMATIEQLEAELLIFILKAQKAVR